MPKIETAQQWDDEWWRLWEDARASHDGEAAARHADLEMARHGARPDDPLPPRGFRLDRLDELLAEIAAVDEPLPIELDNSSAQFVPVEPRVPYAAFGQVELTPERDGFVYTFEESRPRSRGFQAEHVIVDELQRFMATGKLDDDPSRRFVRIAREREPRRGWLGRLLDRVFGGQA